MRLKELNKALERFKEKSPTKAKQDYTAQKRIGKEPMSAPIKKRRALILQDEEDDEDDITFFAFTLKNLRSFVSLEQPEDKEERGREETEQRSEGREERREGSEERRAKERKRERRAEREEEGREAGEEDGQDDSFEPTFVVSLSEDSEKTKSETVGDAREKEHHLGAEAEKE